ncbi:hypothetical protein R3P38DRAFT_2784789 [Favolaschia claudopus]|uniref:Uncharacterized protein n=1 Tax=Favolaschia claudopus TaxID=2862362 RepID=A0AAW0AXZ8_9AGAR
MKFPLTFFAIAFAAGAYAQNLCSTVPSDVLRQVSEMQTFNNRVPPPSSTSTVDCINGKSLKKGIDAYYTAPLLSLTRQVDVFQTVLTSGFNAQYTVLGKFVAACP